MDAAYISALAALGGSTVGALASFMTTWITMNGQERAKTLTRTRLKRENLYGEFIEEASKLFTDALSHELDDVSKFVELYALTNKLRLFAPADVLVTMDAVADRILETYRSPNLDLRTRDAQPKMDILRAFSEACRKDLYLHTAGRCVPGGRVPWARPS
jgi:hypothetical protein